MAYAVAVPMRRYVIWTTGAQCAIQPVGKDDSIMAKQAAFSGSAVLQREAYLAGPPASSKAQLREIENTQSIGGMRRPDKSIEHNPQYRLVGAKIAVALDQFAEDYPEVKEYVVKMRSGVEVQGLGDELRKLLRRRTMEVLGADVGDHPVAPGPDADLIEAWGLATEDPDASRILPGWMRSGAPIGLEGPIEVCGVFPPACPQNASLDALKAFDCDLAGWANYQSAEDEPDIVKGVLRKQEAAGHCKCFDSMEKLTSYLEVDTVVLSKLALISKTRADGSVSHRLIWDLLRSRVNESVRLSERIILPRLQDVVEDSLELARGSEHPVEYMVLDVADAFHNIPIQKAERRYCCGLVDGVYVAFEVLCMGGKASPNIWGRFAAMLGRWTASLYQSTDFRN